MPPSPSTPHASASRLSPGVRAMLWSALAFSVMSVLVKTAATRLPTPQIALLRAVVSLALSYVALRRAGLSLKGRRPWRLVLRGVLGFVGLHAYYFALAELPLAEATVLQFLNPVLVAIAAPFVLREKPGPRDWLGTLAGFAGVVLIARPTVLFGAASTPLSTAGVLVGLLGALFSALVYLLVRQMRDEHPLVVVFYFPLVVIPLTLPVAAAVWVWPTPLEWLALAGVGVATQVGQVKMTESLHLEPAARATAVSFAQVPFAMFFSTLVFHEAPPLLTWLGAALVFVGTLAVSSAKVPPKTDDAAKTSDPAA